jgi:hypothetical protein
VEDTEVLIPQDDKVLFIGNHYAARGIDGKQFYGRLEILGSCLHHLTISIEDPALDMIIGGAMNDKFDRFSVEENTKRE